MSMGKFHTATWLPSLLDPDEVESCVIPCDAEEEEMGGLAPWERQRGLCGRVTRMPPRVGIAALIKGHNGTLILAVNSWNLCSWALCSHFLASATLAFVNEHPRPGLMGRLVGGSRAHASVRSDRRAGWPRWPSDKLTARPTAPDKLTRLSPQIGRAHV